MLTNESTISASVNVSKNRQSYVPPSYVDHDRASKIRAVIPEIDSRYKAFAEKYHLPGYSYGIVADGKIVHLGSGGYSNLDSKILVTPKSMFRIASMTKSFTAMAILQLRDAGKLRLDDPVSSYIPEIQNYRLTVDAPAITIGDLLIHTSGLPTDDPWADRKLGETEEDIVNLLMTGVHFSNVAGIDYEYSNLGYAILGLIIQKITGIAFGKYISKFIWTPLGMKDASWEYRDIESAQLVQGYGLGGENWMREALLSDGVYAPMGGAITSIEAFSQYMAWHLSVWPPRDDAETGPLKRSSVREMHQPRKFIELSHDFQFSEGREYTMTKWYGYGLRWLRDQLGRVFVGHCGGLPGFGSNWYFMPDYGVGVAALANVTYAPMAKINLEVLDTLVMVAQLGPRQVATSAALKEKQNALMKLLPHWEGAEDSGLFADNFFLDYPLESLRFQTESQFMKVGKIVVVEDLIPKNQLRGSFIVRGELSALRVSFSLTPENPSRIQEFRIEIFRCIDHFHPRG